MKVVTAAFEAQYAPRPGNGECPATELTAHRVPAPCSSMTGTKGTTVFVTPFTFTPMSQAISSDLPSRTPFGMPTPAFAKTRSTPPAALTNSLALRAMKSVSATSPA